MFECYYQSIDDFIPYSHTQYLFIFVMHTYGFMKQLPQGKSHLIKNMVKPLNHHLLLSSVLKGKTYSTMYIDDNKNPKKAILWVKGKLYFLGKPGNNSHQVEILVKTKYYNYLRKHKANSFTLFFNEEWKPSLENMFPNQLKQEYVRSYYCLKVDTFSPKTENLLNIQIKPITQELITSSYKNLELVKEEICSERYSIDDFFEKSFGFVAMDGDEIVS